MTAEQKRMIDILNDMYQSQGVDFRNEYRDNYFELLQYIIFGDIDII